MMDKKTVLMSAVLLAAGALCGFQNDRPRSVNEASRFALVQSLLEQGRADVGKTRFFNSVDMIGHGGKYYSDKPPLLSLYSVAVLKPWVPPMSFNRPEDAAALHRASVLTLNALFLTVLLIVMLRTGAAAGSSAAETLRYGCLAFFSTMLLVYMPAYTSHFGEAALTLCAGCAILADRKGPRMKRAVLAGVCVGVQWSLHPFSGSIVLMSTFAALLLTGWRRAAVFAATALAVIGAGLAVNHALYGSWKLFYFDPENYLFKWGPGGASLSQSFENPSNPGLTVQKIADRIRELGLSEEVVRATVQKFIDYRQSVSDLPKYAVRTFLSQDFWVLNPFVTACGLVWTKDVLKKRVSSWGEVLWVAMTVGGIYAGSIYLRSYTGESFGNRHLIPAMAALVIGYFASKERERFDGLLTMTAAFSLPMMLIGVTDIWKTPGRHLADFNLVMTLVLYAVSLLWAFVPFVERALGAWWAGACRHRWILPAAVWALLAAEWWAARMDRPALWGEMAIPVILSVLGSVPMMLMIRPDRRSAA